MANKDLKICIGNATDSYKLTHWRIYNKGLTNLYSYFEARSQSVFDDEVVFFGLQYFIKRYLSGGVITRKDLPRLKAFCKHHFGNVDGLFNEAGWKYIIEKKNGRLPVSIMAVPEGTVIPVGNVLMTVENTDPNCAWLTNFLETLLVEIWNPITVASLSRSIKKTIYRYLNETTDTDLIPLILPSRLHDFGYRGVSSPESAGLAGAGHLVNFAGTDTIAAIDLVNQYYNGEEYSEAESYDQKSDEEWSEEESYKNWESFYFKNMPGFSLPATEHSQMTLGGPDGELDICRNLLNEFPTGYVACVSDSFDLFRCVEQYWGTELKDQILNRKGTLVVRSDSGNPREIVLKVLESLESKFGSSLNKKGYKVLPSCVRVIQGDGVNEISLRDVLQKITQNGWSAENLAFGSGGALLQKVNRDTFSFAFKCSSAVIDGVEREIYKQPKTDSKKNSKRGRLALVQTPENNFTTVAEKRVSHYKSGNILREVFRDGRLLVDQSFADIRKRAELK